VSSLSGNRSRSSTYLLLLGMPAAVLAGFALAYVDVGPMVLSQKLRLPLGMLLLVPFSIALLRLQPITLLEPIFVVVFGYELFLFLSPAYIVSFDDFETMYFLGASKEVVLVAIGLATVGLVTLYHASRSLGRRGRERA